jgi:chaperonin GroES
MLKPLQDKIIVQIPKELEQKTASGLILAGLQDEKKNEGLVIAVGPGITLDNGQTLVPDLSVGDSVVFAKYQGTEIEHDGEDYLILAYRDIVAVVGKD